MDEKKKRIPRPWWMINGAPEPLGDVFADRSFPEWIRLRGGESRDDRSTDEKR